MKSRTERFEQIIPVLRIFDVTKAKEFYIGFLGLKVNWEHRFSPQAPLYMQGVAQEAGVASFRSPWRLLPGIDGVCSYDGTSAFHREITSKDFHYMKPGIERAPWKANCMEVIDPLATACASARICGERNPH